MQIMTSSTNEKKKKKYCNLQRFQCSPALYLFACTEFYFSFSLPTRTTFKTTTTPNILYKTFHILHIKPMLTKRKFFFAIGNQQLRYR